MIYNILRISLFSPSCYHGQIKTTDIVLFEVHVSFLDYNSTINCFRYNHNKKIITTVQLFNRNTFHIIVLSEQFVTVTDQY